MQEEKIEGIVVRAQDYKERHRIITLFSPQGMLSLIVKGISRKNARLLTLTTVFSYGEYIYRTGRSELFLFLDGTVLSTHLALRQNLQFLQTAGALANAILASQMAGKPAPALFTLYKSYHAQVPSFKNPAPLLASFYLKLLKHEGLLSVTPFCSICRTALARSLHNGESLCPLHSPHDGICFSEQEWENLLSLDNVQQFSTLRARDLSPAFTQKVHTLFLSRLT
jgi:DNA repair protein RecO (recombination protein O)